MNYSDPFEARLHERLKIDLAQFQLVYRQPYDLQNPAMDPIIAHSCGDPRRAFFPSGFVQTPENRDRIAQAIRFNDMKQLLGNAAVPSRIVPVNDAIDDGLSYLPPNAYQPGHGLNRPQGGVPGYNPDSFVSTSGWVTNPQTGQPVWKTDVPIPYPTVPGAINSMPPSPKSPRKEKRVVHDAEAAFVRDQGTDVENKTRAISGQDLRRKDRKAIGKTARWVRKFTKH